MCDKVEDTMMFNQSTAAKAANPKICRTIEHLKFQNEKEASELKHYEQLMEKHYEVVELMRFMSRHGLL